MSQSKNKRDDKYVVFFESMVLPQYHEVGRGVRWEECNEFFSSDDASRKYVRELEETNAKKLWATSYRNIKRYFLVPLDESTENSSS